MQGRSTAIPRTEGPHIVAIGGGTGLSTMLRGLKDYTENITAIVTVADDGGGSGVLRQELGMPPPGDIRNCLVALANAEPLMSDLMNYRFSEGSLAGQSFGNLFLAALNALSPSFDEAVSRMSEVLAITGRVLPVTTADVQLVAELEDGSSVVGESKIFKCKKEKNCRIRRVHLLPERPYALCDALDAITRADMIVFGPGSLYTSIIPNFLVGGIVDALRASRAMKVYVCNIMTQEGETEGYTAADHIRALFSHSYEGLFNICVVNSAPISRELCALYREEGAQPIECSEKECAALGVEVVRRPLSIVRGKLVRHDAPELARVLLQLFRERSVRMSDGRYITE
ncbi:MAG: YvcK family protein [Oscillospiraceae bacterium]|nr:YvcK family protein [Oscillospiraceae bacterium]